MATETMEQHALNTGRTFVWHEVYGPNADDIIDFYTSALDFGTESMDHPMGKYRMLTKNGQGVAGVMSTSEMDMKDVPPHWATYLAVDDVDKRLEKCKQKGAKVVVQPMDVPKVGRMALIQDPAGAHIWLYKEGDMG